MQPFDFAGSAQVETNLQSNQLEDLSRRTEALRGYL
jgi:hypothetical protein